MSIEEWRPKIGDFVGVGNLNDRGEQSFSRKSGGLCGRISKIRIYEFGKDRVQLCEPEKNDCYREEFESCDFFIGSIWGDLDDVYPYEI